MAENQVAKAEAKKTAVAVPKKYVGQHDSRCWCRN